MQTLLQQSQPVGKQTEGSISATASKGSSPCVRRNILVETRFKCTCDVLAFPGISHRDWKELEVGGIGKEITVICLHKRAETVTTLASVTEV